MQLVKIKCVNCLELLLTLLTLLLSTQLHPLCRYFLASPIIGAGSNHAYVAMTGKKSV